VRDYLSAFPLDTLLFDAAIILFWCAFHHAKEFERGDCLPAVKDFQHYLQYLVSRETTLVMYFDGKSRKEKEPEDLRRQAKREKAKKRWKTPETQAPSRR